jgi:glycosyltransferase involved in cell wall biosynthesis
MTKISAVIVAHNEEKKIADCLKSLNFADEIVVVLDKCTDGTKEIVQKFTDKIIEGSWEIEGVRRNIGLNACSGEWIFEIDADERVSPELAAEILSIKNSEPCMFILPMANFVGKRHVKYGWLRVIGVMDKKILFYRGFKKYHEDKQIHPTGDLKGEVKVIKNPLTHMMDDSVSDLILRFNRNTKWRAHDMVSGGKTHKKQSLFKELVSFKFRFLKSFIAKKGYKEGALGILIALLGASYPLVSRLKAKEILANENN